MSSFFSTLFVSVSLASVSSAQDTTLQNQLRAALGAGDNVGISLDTLTTASWPGVTFFRARRIPVWPREEDPRPAVVSGIVRGSDTVITHGWEHLSELWSIVRPPTLSNPNIFLDRLLVLLDLASIVPDVRLVTSPETALSSAVGWARKDTLALRDIALPTVRRLEDVTIVSLYVRETGGVFRVDVYVTDGGSLEYSVTPVLETSLSH